MRTKGSGEELEHRRRLGVRRVLEGHSCREVAAFLEVRERTVERWMAAYHQNGWAGLSARPNHGPPARLTEAQQAEVVSWVSHPAREFGFFNELWTAPRVAQVIERTFGVHYHPRYLNIWLHARGITPQKPRRQARERHEEQIQAWRDDEWPRIKKKGGRDECISGLAR
jgi:transposase